MSCETAIRVQRLGKSYLMYDKPSHRLWQMFLRDRRQLYRSHNALQDVSFQVQRGDTVGVIGRNGSGKSTLLQILCGTVQPTQGEIAVQGRVAALLELGSGFNPEFTGRENVYLNAEILGLSTEEVAQRFEAIAAFADIGEFIDRQVKTYSSGMYLRLAFAVIAHVDADILVIDEALAVGDAFFVQKCMRFLREFRKHGTIFFVSHDTSAVTGLCDRALWLEQGTLRLEGTAKEVCEAYLEAVFRSHQGADGSHTTVATEQPPPVFRDMRQDWVNQTNLRNDLEVFAFDPEAAGFGKRNVVVTAVRFADRGGVPLSWVVGGEPVVLEVAWQAHAPASGLIFGFNFKDRLGQVLFGDNTFLSRLHDPVVAQAGEEGIARFAFHMPVLPKGHYSLTAAVAEGTQEDHVQHHWLHDALTIVSHSTSVATGLVGVPMEHIEVERYD